METATITRKSINYTVKILERNGIVGPKVTAEKLSCLLEMKAMSIIMTALRYLNKILTVLFLLLVMGQNLKLKTINFRNDFKSKVPA